jgi:hypothetical protein
MVLGGSIPPSPVAPDPRYISIKGTTATGSRIRHAMFSPFVAKGISGSPTIRAWVETWHHRRSRTFMIRNPIVAPDSCSEILRSGTAERIGASLAQRFLLGKFPEGVGI